MSKKNTEVEIGGKFECIKKVNGLKVAQPTYIKKVKYNGPATIVFWSDSTKTVAKCSPNDVYSAETGLAICCLKKLVGASHVFNLFHSWLPREDEFKYGEELNITKCLGDVRRKLKNE